MSFSFRGDGFHHLKSKLACQKGQSVTEYILVLFVAVLLILTFLWLFSTAFQAWANNYFGDYLACILETGELPDIGGKGGDSTQCDQYFEPFSLKNGRPLKLSGTTGGGATGPGPGANALNDNGSPGGYRVMGPSGGSPWGSGGAGGQNGSSGDGAGGNGQNHHNGDGSLSYVGGGYSSGQGGSGREDGGFTDGRIPIHIKKDGGYKRGYTSPTDRAQTEFRPNKLMLLKPKRAPAKAQDADVSFTIGNFFRILIIAAIIIALVVVIGGQMLQISKSMDSD